MVVMKYTIPNYFNNHTVLANFLGFDGSKNYGLHGHVANTAPYCAVPGIADVLPCSDKDMRVFWTSEGICATINAPPVNSIFKNTQHLAFMNSIFEVNPDENEYFNGSVFKDIYDLDVVVDSKTLFLTSPFRGRHNDEEAIIYFAVNEFDAPFNTFYAKEDIQMGQQITFKLTPTLLGSLNSLQSLQIEDRNCRYRHEADDMEIFKQYTQEACEFECMVKYAITKCGNCVPWHLPMVRAMFSEDVPVCDGFHTRCFSKIALTNMTHKALFCNCLPSCTLYQVALEQSMQPNYLMLDHCEDTLEMGQIYIKDLIGTMGKDPLIYHNAMEQNSLVDRIGVNFSNVQQTCHRLLYDEVTILKFQLSRITALKMIQDVRVTLIDRIGAIGGTMGLFTGFSLLSIIEIIFYSWRCAYNLVVG